MIFPVQLADITLDVISHSFIMILGPRGWVGGFTQGFPDGLVEEQFQCIGSNMLKNIKHSMCLYFPA